MCVCVREYLINQPNNCVHIYSLAAAAAAFFCHCVVVVYCVVSAISCCCQEFSHVWEDEMSERMRKKNK